MQIARVPSVAVRMAAIASAFALLLAACAGSSATELVDDADAVASTVAEPTAAATASATAAEPTSAPMSQPTVAPEPAPTPEPTVAPEPKSADALTLLDEAFLVATADQVAPSLTDGVFLFATIDGTGTAAAGSAGTDSDGSAPTLADPFRVGSLSRCSRRRRC